MHVRLDGLEHLRFEQHLLEAESIECVVLVGPAHRAFVPGLATTSLDAWLSPLGEVAIDGPAAKQAVVSAIEDAGYDVVGEAA